MSSTTFYNATNLVGVGSVAVGGFIPIAGGPTLGVIGNVYASTGFWGAGNNISNVQVSTSFSGLNPGGVIYAQTVNQIISSAAGSSGQFLVSGGSGAPTFKYIAASDLPVSGVSAGTSGSGTLIPVITYDTYGRLTSVSTSAVSVNPITGGTTYAPIVATGATTLASLSSAGSVGQPLLSGGAGANPSYGTLGVAYGGSGATSFTANALIAGGTTTTGVHQSIATGSSDQVLVSSGALGIPIWTTDISGKAANVTGIVPIANGGTGISTTAPQNNMFAGPSSGGSGAPLFRNIVAGDLPTSGVGAGTVGSATAIPAITYDTYGRITSVATNTILSASTQYAPLYALTATTVGAIASVGTSGQPLLSGGSGAAPQYGILQVASGGTGTTTSTGTGSVVLATNPTLSGPPAAAGNVLTVIGSSTIGNVFQFSNSTTAGNFIMTNSGKIGIGMTNPSYALDVNGFIRTVYPLIVDTTATGSNYSAFRITAGGDGQCYIQAGSSLTSAATANVLFTGINGSPERMRINLTSGNVGIGTVSPTSLLHLYGSGVQTQTGQGSMQIQGSGGLPLNINYSGPGGSFNCSIYSVCGTATNPSVKLFRYIGYLLADSSSGNLGGFHMEGVIGGGANNPGGGAYLKADITNRGVVGGYKYSQITGGSIGSDMNVFMVSNTSSTNIDLYIQYGGNTYNGFNLDIKSFWDTFTFVNIEGVADPRTSPTSYATYWDLITSVNFTQKASSGNVGIGTASPGSALQVVGTVTATTFSGSAASLTSFPTLNQNTTGSAGSLSTTLTSSYILYGQGTGIPASSSGFTYNDATKYITIGASTTTLAGINLPTGGAGINWGNYYSRIIDDGDLRFITDDNMHWHNGSSAAAPTGTEKMTLLANGNFGIGTVSPSYTLDVTGAIRATGDIIAYSDLRVKSNLEKITGALDKVAAINGYTFTRSDGDSDERHAGVVAQEVQEVLPEVVSVDKEGRLSVAYGNMVALLIEALKEEKSKREALEGELEVARRDHRSLEGCVTQMQVLLSKVLETAGSPL